MKEQIENLEKVLRDLKESYEKKEKEIYLNQPHKDFNVGDWVFKDDLIGVVYWIENKYMNISKSDGYMAVDLKTGRLGLMTGVKTDEWDLLEGDLLKYFTKSVKYTINLTGEDLERLKYDLSGRNVNPSNPKNKLFDIIEANSLIKK